MRVAAVILAAGASTRFGSPKQLATVGGRTLLESVAGVATAAGLHPVMAVVPPGMAVPPSVVPVLNDSPSDGLSRSVRLGLGAVPPELDGAVLLLGDQPTLAVETIRAVLDAARDGRPIAAAHAAGRVAPPVLLLRAAFGIADDASGEEGLRRVLARSSHLVTLVDVGRHAPDVDTVADLEALGGRIAHMFDSSADG